jgi:hypothetical protein
MAAKLPAYSGQIALCPKCDASIITTIYHTTNIGCFHWRDGADGEHLGRICRNCGYKWPKACADSGDDSKTLRRQE